MLLSELEEELEQVTAAEAQLSTRYVETCGYRPHMGGTYSTVIPAASVTQLFAEVGV
jgi:hypothetical protein